MYETPYLTKPLLGKILYHACTLKLTPINIKPIFNTHNNSFEIRLIYTSIDWSIPKITISSITLIDWESSYLRFIYSIPSYSNLYSNLTNNSDSPLNNLSENSNPSISDSQSSTPFNY